MQPSLTKRILEHLAESGELMIGAFFPHSGMWSGFLPNIYPKGKRDNNHPPPTPPKHLLSSILWRLKKEGLVTSSGKKGAMCWKITPRGLHHLKKKARSTYPRIAMILPVDGILRLVSFDVPEKERSKRDWLRKELIACGFNPLQKSVFIGTRPLPEDFIKNIDHLNLGECVHITRVEKSGTIRTEK